MPQWDECSKVYSKLDLIDKQKLFDAYKDPQTAKEYKDEVESYLFRVKPPTAEEFLDPANRWLTKDFIDSMFPAVKEDFINVINNNKYYQQVVDYGATGIGKSTKVSIFIMYTITYMHCLRQPAMYFGLAPTAKLAIYLMSLNYGKAAQLLLGPLFDLLKESPRFHRVRTRDQVPKVQAEMGLDYIVYSKTAGDGDGEITLECGLRIFTGNTDPLTIIGANVIQMYVTEIAFFIEKAGATEEQIFRLYTDGLDRIQGRLGKETELSFVYLDSSANIADSMIENHILKKLRFDKYVYFRWRARWEGNPDGKQFKIWRETGETFRVIHGNGAIPPKIVTCEEDLINIPEDLVHSVPIDVKSKYEDALSKSIKDISGRPQLNENKFIQSMETIERMFDPILPNIEGSIICDSSELPDLFLWDAIKDKFFIKYDGKNYIINRAVQEPRWIGVDLAKAAAGDVTGITMLHKEMCKKSSEVVYVVDFSFAVGPGENGINLEAIHKFIHNLNYMGNIHFNGIAVDTYQSGNFVQYLERFNIPVINQSVDKTINPYMTVYTQLLANKKYPSLKAGRNIFLKNNLNSLQKKKEKGRDKIDHSDGVLTYVYNGSWNDSQAGKFAKDVSDSLAQALYLAHNDDYIPETVYEHENQKKELNVETKQNEIPIDIILNGQSKEIYDSLIKPLVRFG